MIGYKDIGGLCSSMQINTKEMRGQRSFSNYFTRITIVIHHRRIVPLLNFDSFVWQILQCMSIQGLASSGGGSNTAGGDGGTGGSSGASRALVKDR